MCTKDVILSINFPRHWRSPLLPSDEVGDQHPGGAGLAVVSWVPGRVFALLPVVRMLRSATDARPVTAGARPKPGKVATALCRD